MGKLIGRFGRRGVVLGLLGSVWTLIGYGFATMPQDRFSRPGTEGPLQFLDTTPWFGLVWIAGGVAAMVCAARRGSTLRDDYGFNGLALPAFMWAAFYFWSWLTNVLLDGQSGRPGSWLGTLVFVAVVVFVLFIARWPDPDDPHLRRGGREWSE